MSHEYPDIVEVVGGWLRSATTGRFLADQVMRPKTGVDQLFTRRFGRPHEPLAWRVGGVFYFNLSSSLTGGRDTVIIGMIRATGSPLVLVDLDLFRKIGLFEGRLDPQSTDHLGFSHAARKTGHDGEVTADLLDVFGRRFLCGRDELSGRRYLAGVPLSVISVDEAFRLFTPQTVLDARAQGLPYFRQGSWFFIRRGTALPSSIEETMKRPFSLPEADGRASSHKSDRGEIHDGRVYVTGLLRHGSSELLQLDGLWEAVTAAPLVRAA